MAKLEASPDHKAASKNATQAEDDVKQARKASDPNLPAISTRWIDAKAKVSQLEVAAMRAQELKNLNAAVAAAGQNVATIQKQIDERNRRAAEAQAAAKEAASRYPDPDWLDTRRFVVRSITGRLLDADASIDFPYDDNAYTWHDAKGTSGKRGVAVQGTALAKNGFGVRLKVPCAVILLFDPKANRVEEDTVVIGDKTWKASE
jgi:hypothetical protein